MQYTLRTSPSSQTENDQFPLMDESSSKSFLFHPYGCTVVPYPIRSMGLVYLPAFG